MPRPPLAKRTPRARSDWCRPSTRAISRIEASDPPVSVMPRYQCVDVRGDEDKVGRLTRHVCDDDGLVAPPAGDLRHRVRGKRRGRGREEPIAVALLEREKRDRRNARLVLVARRAPDRRHDVFVQRVGRIDLNDRERARLLAGQHQGFGVAVPMDDGHLAPHLRSEGERLVDAALKSRVDHERARQARRDAGVGAAKAAVLPVITGRLREASARPGRASSART